MALNELSHPHHDGSPIRGEFRLTHYRERAAEGGVEGVLTLEDASGRFDQIIADEDPMVIRDIGWPRLVRAVIQPVFGCDQTTAIVLTLEEIGVEEVDNGAALLPRAECSEKAISALETLVAFNASIVNPYLKSFLTRVLLDDVIAYPLMDQSAGLTSAHPYNGGLLVHGTEWLDEAGRLAYLVFPESQYGASAWNCVTVTQLGYLFHDLYRVLLNDRDVPFSDRYLGKLMLNLLEPHLDWLAQRDESLALDLRMLLMPDDGQSVLPMQVVLARNVIQWCDDQRQLRDQMRIRAQKACESVATDSAYEVRGALSMLWLI